MGRPVFNGGPPRLWKRRRRQTKPPEGNTAHICLVMAVEGPSPSLGLPESASSKIQVNRRVGEKCVQTSYLVIEYFARRWVGRLQCPPLAIFCRSSLSSATS